MLTYITCQLCKEQLFAIGEHNSNPLLRFGEVHASVLTVMVLAKGDRSGHPAGSWFVKADCPRCKKGSGEFYVVDKHRQQGLFCWLLSFFC